MPALEARGLTRTYPARRGAPAITALDRFSITIHAGEHVALLGPNGAGKSTFLRLVCALDRADRGEILLFGAPPARARRRLGVIFQRPALDPVLTIRENLALAASLYGLSDARDRVDAAAASVDIADRLDSRVGSLSGGLARRADLARALLAEPDLLLLDEPTTGLDHAARARFLDAIEERRRERPDLTILMSTHLMDEAERATRVALLDRGRLVADAPPQELRASVGAGRLIHTSIAARSALEGARLEIAERDGRLCATGGPEQLEHAATQLIAAGVAFEVAPPTLGDAYLHLTGRDLTDAEPVAEGAA